MLSDQRPEWKALQKHYAANQGLQIHDLFALDQSRYSNFHLAIPGMLIDYSRHRVTRETLDLLLGLARACDAEGWRNRMFSGEPINNSENRPVLHTALRRPVTDDIRVGSENIMPFIHDVLTRMEHFTKSVHNGQWTGHTGKRIQTIINIGIGGSDLGPRMAVEALRPYHVKDLKIHFVANVDGSDLFNALKNSDPETTLFLVASKTFTTQETMANAQTARAWLTDQLGPSCVHRHFVAMSTNAQAVHDFGISIENMFPFGEWVGGRYSLWSAIGLSIALAVGFDHFRALLDGARAMDQHFQTAPLDQNAPVLLAMIGIWYRNFCGMECHAILPYDQNLSRFPAYLQQADMESNGKSVSRDGEAIPYATGPVIFGEPGTNGQHAFYQLIHQGRTIIPCDFIGSFEPQNPYSDHHRLLLANMVAQADALMEGRSLADSGNDPARSFSGNRPSTIIMTDRLTPFALGQLIALYEHKIFVQGIVWGINSFDQWGVELGKILANKILRAFESNDIPAQDGLLKTIKSRLKA
ncbi:MAG: glucose-6-phosphate isomerase [Micavibrio sp.]